MNKIKYKILVIALLLAWGSTIPLALILMILPFDWTETFLIRFIPIYVQLSAAGIYIGFTKTEHKLLHGAVTGILLEVSLWAYSYFKTSMLPHFDLANSWRVVRFAIVCGLAAWLTGKIIDLRRAVKKQHKDNG